MVSSTRILKIPYRRTSDRIKDIEVYPATIPPVEVQIHQMVVWRTINGRWMERQTTREKMERYKLKKEYPGSPKKGSVVYSGHKREAYSDYKYKLRNEPGVSNDIFFDKNDIEGYPDNWKKLNK
jgi:hypothetical protein